MDASLDIEHIGIIRQVGFQTIDTLADTLVLIHAEDAHVVILHDFCMKRIAGIRGMSLDTHIPLDSTGKPCVAQRQMAGLEYRVHME